MPNLIQISQKKISIGEKYSISINGMPTLKAARRLWKLFPLIEVMHVQGGDPIYSIEQRYAFLRPSFIFNFGPNRYELTTISWWKRHYQVHMGQDIFDIYGHRGRKVSIFLNGRQVAWFDSAAVTFFSGDQYTIHADAAVSVDWMVAIVLFWDCYYNRRNKSAVNIRFGSLVQAIPFDRTWVPS